MSYQHATIQPGIYQTPPFSVEVPNSPQIEGETIPRVHPDCVHGLISIPEEGVTTLFDVLVRSKVKYGDLPGFGTRKLIKEHHEVREVKSVIEGKEVVEKKKWTLFEMGEYEYLTYGEYVDFVMGVGAGLRKLGMVKGDRLHVFASTSMNWLAASHAATTQSIPIVTSYATLGESGLTTSLTETSVTAIFTDPELLPKLLNPLKHAPSVKYIIYNSTHPVNPTHLNTLKTAHPHIQIISLSALHQLGVSNPMDPQPPKPSDLACIMYTSGTTGTPKGVSLTHSNIVAAIAGLHTTYKAFISSSDSILAYLPLSHSFEFCVENTCFFWGIRLGYGSPRTLSSSSMRNCAGDLKAFKPSVLVGVPAIWETVRKGTEAKVAAQGPVMRNLFWGALRLKEYLCKWHLPGTGVLDAMVFKKVRDETGGRLRACFNGASALGEETRKFISLAVAPLVNGYGLTETCAMGILQSPLQWTSSTLGTPSGSVAIKLLSQPALSYLTTTHPPQGEILIRGASVTAGYYLNPTATAESFTPDGWFKTGDIGEWTSEGHLKIIDRVKNLVKMSGGEYVALEKLESVYRTCNLVANACVYAEEGRSRPVVVVVLAAGAARGGGKEVLLRELQSIGKKAGLAGFEIVEDVIVSSTDWTVENGCLTPAQKLNRRVIIPLYRKELDALLGKTRAVL